MRHHLPLVSVSPAMNSLCGLVPKAKSLAICLDLNSLLFLPQLLLLEVTYRYLGIVARFLLASLLSLFSAIFAYKVP